jgi:hypothetical protein
VGLHLFKPDDLEETDRIAAAVLEEMLPDVPDEIRSQMEDNLLWIKQAGANKLVVGSQARILYADSEGRIRIAAAFNKAIGTDVYPVRLCLAGTIMMCPVQTLPTGKHLISMTVHHLQPTWPYKM